MSYGYEPISYGDDQVTVDMISEFDTEPYPGLYDTTRADIFKMVSSPCFKCDGQFKGMPKQPQFGPPFRPPCESSMSAKNNVISEVKARYPENGVQCMACGNPSGPTSPQMSNVPITPEGKIVPNRHNSSSSIYNIGVNQSNEPYANSPGYARTNPMENYQTFGGCPCPDRPYVSANGRQVGCSCLGLVGTRRLPEGSQAGVFPGVNMTGPVSPWPMVSSGFGLESFTNKCDSMLNLMFLFLLIIVIYLSFLHGKLCGNKEFELSAQKTAIAT